MKKTQKVPVSERALIQRINRKLKADWRQLKTTRGVRAREDLGYFYVLDTRRNFIIDHHVDLETFGRVLGALAESEELILEEEES